MDVRIPEAKGPESALVQSCAAAFQLQPHAYKSYSTFAGMYSFATKELNQDDMNIDPFQAQKKDIFCGSTSSILKS